jgi:hypothetical protein
MLIAPLRVPAAAGSKVTLMVQVALAAKDAGHVLVWAKSPAFVPVRVISAIVNAALPLLVSVTLCAALVVPAACEANVKLVGASVTAGAVVAVVPVPANGTVCGLPAALSAMLRAALRAPAAAGSKVTLMAQFALAANEAGQVLV